MIILGNYARSVFPKLMANRGRIPGAVFIYYCAYAMCFYTKAFLLHETADVSHVLDIVAITFCTIIIVGLSTQAIRTALATAIAIFAALQGVRPVLAGFMCGVLSFAIPLDNEDGLIGGVAGSIATAHIIGEGNIAAKTTAAIAAGFALSSISASVASWVVGYVDEMFSPEGISVCLATGLLTGGVAKFLDTQAKEFVDDMGELDDRAFWVVVIAFVTALIIGKNAQIVASR